MEYYVFFAIAVILVLIVVVQHIYTMSMSVVFSGLMEQIRFHFNKQSCLHMMAHSSYQIRMYIYDCMLGCKFC